ncbi:aminotransferase class IV [Marinobacter pelagius]|uniref:aminotransferase class IV n=1 Tax=Marinobacter sp. C7 TaxID=2951363 RepID=UPI001EF159C2|nr:aminotransferase class IV [Marinobacter sp. C7]MCG7199280.1 aminotransferase class IV [Marinobacter sp. C7]
MVQVFWAEEGGLPANDRGLAYGDGLFETILMQGARGTLVAQHLERLVRDAEKLGIAVTDADIKHVYARAASHYGRSRPGTAWVLKLIVTRGAGGRGYHPDPDMSPNLLVSANAAPPGVSSEGVRVDYSRIPLTVNPVFAGIKSLNRLEQVMAARELAGDVFEVLQSDRDGHLVEGTRTNLLLNTGQGWVTPPRDSLAVAGVMRQWVMDRLRSLGETVVERPLIRQDIESPNIRGFYLLNSVLGVVAVRNLDGRDLPVDKGLATICDPLETLE